MSEREGRVNGDRGCGEEEEVAVHIYRERLMKVVERVEVDHICIWLATPVALIAILIFLFFI